MSWSLKKDTLFDKANEIGYFLPTANEHERKMIKNGDDLVSFIGEFLIGYDETKSFPKKLFLKWQKIIDTDTNYIKNWSLSREGELGNENYHIILILTEYGLKYFGKIIQFLPEIYSCSQELLNNMSSTNAHQLKKWYDKFCDFHDKIIE